MGTQDTGDTQAIRTEGLTKHFGDVRAVHELTLSVPRGEIFGFLGPNGAGKTTAMRTMLDFLRPTSGKAWILGLDSHADTVEIRRHIGFLPGDLALYPNLSGRELLTYFANLRGGVNWSYVDELVQRFGADPSRKIGEMSTGNRQKIGLIQAFMNKPDLLLLDEPSSGLDPLVQNAFHVLVKEVAANGAAVFLSSHTLSEVERVAERVGILRSGTLAVVETMEALKQKAIRKVVMEFPRQVAPGPFETIAGVREVSSDGNRITVALEGSMAEVLSVAAAHGVSDLSNTEADLEEIFLDYYRDSDQAKTR